MVVIENEKEIRELLKEYYQYLKIFTLLHIRESNTKYNVPEDMRKRFVKLGVTSIDVDGEHQKGETHVRFVCCLKGGKELIEIL